MMIRNLLLSTLLAAAPASAFAAGPIVMHRDPGCGCCEKWARQMEQAFRRPVRVVDDGSRAAFRRARGVPDAASSCHTAIVDGLVVEGHVPPADIRRALANRSNVTGLAVAGMPAGSPGMETPNGRRDRFDVVALGPDGARVFARHGG